EWRGMAADVAAAPARVRSFSLTPSPRRRPPRGRAPDPVRKGEFLPGVCHLNLRHYHATENSFVDVDVPIVALVRYEVSNLIKDIPVAHRAQHFLGVSVGNCVLELAANQSAPSTFELNRCDIVCDTHPSFIAF